MQTSGRLGKQQTLGMNGMNGYYSLMPSYLASGRGRFIERPEKARHAF
jgi:hypothetical protein